MVKLTGGGGAGTKGKAGPLPAQTILCNSPLNGSWHQKRRWVRGREGSPPNLRHFFNDKREHLLRGGPDNGRGALVMEGGMSGRARANSKISHILFSCM